MMNLKLVALLVAVVTVSSSWAEDKPNDTDTDLEQQTPAESLQATDREAWSWLKPWRLTKWGRMIHDHLHPSDSTKDAATDHQHHKLKRKIKLILKIKNFESMYYVDTQRSLTRRSSSLLATTVEWEQSVKEEMQSTARGESATQLSEASGNLPSKGPVENELVTVLFDSMLECIVESWDPIQPGESIPNVTNAEKVGSEDVKLVKRKEDIKRALKKRSRSKSEIDVLSINAPPPKPQSWWTTPDERAVIKFINGNSYEGPVSMKTMHGNGRFQWADGTVYMGDFEHNAMTGRGCLYWKDDTWYSGGFTSNLRHGRGLYVDSRRQRCYAGGWHLGAKHGQGTIYYDYFRSSYDGEWLNNIRHGFGSREYSATSGYRGEWDHYERNGKGLMIWPNRDFYNGGWKDGLMSDYGIYIWDTYKNNTMSRPTLHYYNGVWLKGERNGYGVLTFGYGLGAYYKGGFENNKKHGEGKLVTANGFMIKDKKLFTNGNMNSLVKETKERSSKHLEQPFRFNLCDKDVGLETHIHNALRKMDRQEETRVAIISAYIANNLSEAVDEQKMKKMLTKKSENSAYRIQELIDFEQRSLKKALECYAKPLKNIYYSYATICNKEVISFTPMLIRLYLWQLYYDLDIHEKGLTLVQIDNTFAETPEWLAMSPHNPFEKIHFWQYVHSLISVACLLYCETTLPVKKSNSITAVVSGAFRKFMDTDVLPLSLSRKGKLVSEFGQYIPLKPVYKLYRGIGEPHTVRAFVRAARRQPHLRGVRQPPLVAPEKVTLGKNVYEIGDEMNYVTEEIFKFQTSDKPDVPRDVSKEEEYQDLKLFNFGNLSTRTVIELFAGIFPQIICEDYIMNLDVEMTFFEFFQVFVLCSEESIRVKDEENVWRGKFTPLLHTSDKTEKKKQLPNNISS